MNRDSAAPHGSIKLIKARISSLAVTLPGDPFDAIIVVNYQDSNLIYAGKVREI